MRRLFFAAMTTSLVLAFGVSSNSMAQSFDCKRAITTIEKIICGDEDVNLRDLDAALGKAFSRRIQGTSAAESRRLLLEQRAWLARRLEACHLSLNLQFVELAPYDWSCLDELYRERIAALNHKPIDLVYSGDDRVCPRLHNAMNSYHEKNPGVWLFLEKNVLPTILELAGFESVRWLDSEDAKVFEGHDDVHRAMIFEGDVFGDGTTRFVNMSYRNSLPSIFNYITLVFILKERLTKEAAISLRSYWKISEKDYVPVEDVFLAITFYTNRVVEPRKTYTEITFDSPLILFVSDRGVSELAGELLKRGANPFYESGAAQFPLEIDGRVYFFFGSQPFSQEGVLYRVASGLTLEIVCLTRGNTERYIPSYRENR